jgi:hypothetical protein
MEADSELVSAGEFETEGDFVFATSLLEMAGITYRVRAAGEGECTPVSGIPRFIVFVRQSELSHAKELLEQLSDVEERS